MFHDPTQTTWSAPIPIFIYLFVDEASIFQVSKCFLCRTNFVIVLWRAPNVESFTREKWRKKTAEKNIMFSRTTTRGTRSTCTLCVCFYFSLLGPCHGCCYALTMKLLVNARDDDDGERLHTILMKKNYRIIGFILFRVYNCFNTSRNGRLWIEWATRKHAVYVYD